MKRLIAFSSVAHMGFVMLGISTLTDFGINAALFGMVAHGLITGMLFFLAGSVQERYGTREMSRLGGLLISAPRMGWIMGFTAMASLGLPAWPGSGASSRRSSPPTTRAPTSTRHLPHLHGRRRHRHGARRRLPAGDAPAGGDGRARGSSSTPTSTTSTSPSGSRGCRCWSLIVALGVYPKLLFDVFDPAVQNITMHFNGPEVGVTALLAVIEFEAPHLDYHALAPEIIVTATAILVLLVDLFFGRRARPLLAKITAIGFLAAVVPILTLGADGADRSMFGGGYVVDNFALVLKAFFLLVAYVTVLISVDHLADGDYYEGEYFLLMATSVLGMMMMASSRDLISIFVALETISIPTYLLAGWRKWDRKSNEAMLKYFLFGVLSSAVMLYGMSLVYGVAGSTLLD